MDTEKQQLPKDPPLVRRKPQWRWTFVNLACFLLGLNGLRLAYLDRHPSNQGNVEVTANREHAAKMSLTTKEKEDLFLSIPNGESASSAAKQYSTYPHLAGSLEDYHDALTILDLFQTELGITPPTSDPIFPAGTPKSRASTIALTSRLGPRKPTAWVDVYYPEMDRPLDRSLDILDEDGNSVWSVDLVEDGDPLDEDAHKYRDYIPAWHGFSGHGEAEGQLVYANYGTYDDYENILSSGQNLTGKVVIVRYGGIYRGLKIQRAEELGAVGILIYSDPRDDGYVTVSNGFTPYPQGPARNPTSVQRGSAMYLSLYPGDPTTPGYPAYEHAKREEATNYPRIPSLPISWSNAERLLEEIGKIHVEHGGEVSVGEKRRLSGQASEKKIRIVNHVNSKITPIWNTMAAIPGHVRDEVVIVGCHRDAWVLGAADPVSGTVSLHEIVRGFGELLRQGWQPLRTIIIASWDAEEQGLIGSTEYGEDFSEWISEHVVAYLNVDVSSAGSKWDVRGSPSLAHIIKQTALDVPHPIDPSRTLWDARDDEGPFQDLFRGPVGNSSAVVDAEYLSAYENKKKESEELETGVWPLGSGSDYTVFLQRLGVASTDQGFGGTPYDAPYHYHSIYDSFRWQEVYADPGFVRHVAVAKHLGLLALRVTDSIIIPLNTTQYSFELDSYLDKVESLIPDLLKSEPGSFTVDFTSLRKSIANLQEASILLDIEKAEAEERFKDLLSKMPSFPGPSHANLHCKSTSAFTRRVTNWIKGVFGVYPHHHQHHHHPYSSFHAWEDYLSADWDHMDIKSAAVWLEHRLGARVDTSSTSTTGYLPGIPPILEFIKAAKRVSKANKKLVHYERGFISEDGIKGRDWYKHLGVAPGKWLGYGATTLPALTEAITIEKSADAAEYETLRLIELLNKLADDLRP